MIAGVIVAAMAGGAAAVLLLGDDAAPVVTPTPTPTPTLDPSSEPTPTVTPTPTPSGIALGGTCANADEGYTLAYPTGWYTDTVTEAWICALFDPNPFVIEPFTELPITAVLVYVDRNPFDEVVRALTDPNSYRVISLESGEFTDAGLSGVSIQTTQTEPLFYDTGTRFFSVLIDRGPRTIVLQTIDLAGDFKLNKAVVLAMAAQMQLG